MNKLLIIVSVFISIVMWACKHTPPDQPVFTPAGGGSATGGGGTGGGTGSAAVCFEAEVLPIFQTNCAKSGCHDAASHQDGYVLNSYDSLFKKDGKINNNNIRPGDPANSELYKSLFETGSKKMPPTPFADLTAVQKNLIARWINEGAKNTTNCVVSCDSGQFKFAANILPIFQNHCTGCHSGTIPQSGIDLTTYTNVLPSALNGLLYGVVAHLPGYNQMPKGSGKLSDCEIAQIRKWVAAGALNN
jgi:uncharacterized membrane protein